MSGVGICHLRIDGEEVRYGVEVGVEELVVQHPQAIRAFGDGFGQIGA